MPAEIDPTKTHLVLEHKHDRPLVACRFDPTGKYVFFGAEDNLVHRLDLAAKTVTHFAAHESWVRALGCSPDGTLLYSGGYDGRLVIWPAMAEKPEPLHVVEAHQGWLRALAVHPSGAVVATGGNDNDVKFWDAASGDPVGTLTGHAQHVYYVAFDPSGKSLVSCDLKGVVKQWNVATGSLDRDLPPAEALYKYDTTFRADIGGARSLAFSADGKQLAVSGITNVTNAFAGIGNPVVVLYDLADGKIVRTMTAKEKLNGVLWGIAWHPKGFWIGAAGGGGGGWLYFWRGDEDNEFFKLKLPNDARDLALSPDATRVATAHFDKSLRVYALHAAPK
jgi:WD40 repeat protein